MTSTRARSRRRVINPSAHPKIDLGFVPDSWITVFDALDEASFPSAADFLSVPEPPFDSTDDPTLLPAVPFTRDEPWGQMDGESSHHYAWFSYYRSLGLGREVVSVAHHFSIHPNTLYRVAKDHDWSIRALSWDAHRERIYTLQMIEDTRKMAHTHAEIAARGLTALSSAFNPILDEIEENPEAFAAELRALPVRSKLNLAQRSAAVLPSLMTAERVSRGLPSEVRANININESRLTIDSSDDILGVVHVLLSSAPGLATGRVAEIEAAGEDLDAEREPEGPAL